MGSNSIDKYIRDHKKDVDQWLATIYSEYIKKLLINPEDTVINSDRILKDSRRREKLIQVLDHLKVTSKAQLIRIRNPYNRSLDYEDSYELSINEETFKVLAPKYSKPHKFSVIPPDKSFDRVKGYPALDNLTHEGLIHFYFNQDEYTVYDRMEESYNLPSNFNKKTNSKRVIRIYPKNLESAAEKGVFLSALIKYYNVYVHKAIEVLYGYKTKVLSNLPVVNIWHTGDRNLKNMDLRRCNTVSLSNLSSYTLRDMLPEAQELLEYAKGLVEDLTALIPLIEEDNDKLVASLITKAQEELQNKAPLMINSDIEIERTLADMILRGSNKGLI